MKKYEDLFYRILTQGITNLHSISEEEFGRKPSPDKWSKKEILGHLIDSAYNNHARFLKAATKDDLLFDGYEQDDWVRRNNYQNRDYIEIIGTWMSVNNHLIFMLKEMPEEVLLKSTTAHNFHKICMQRIPADQPTTLSYLLWDYLFHMEHHLAQILPNYERLLGNFEG